MDAREELKRCLRAANRTDYFNGGQTTAPRHELGTNSRANLIAEARFWLELIGHESTWNERLTD